MPPRIRKVTTVEVPANDDSGPRVRHFPDGVDMMIRPLSDTQKTVLASLVGAAERDPGKNLELVDVFFRILEKAMADPETDMRRLRTLMIDDKITLESLIAGFLTEEDTVRGGTKAPTRRVRATRG